MTRFLLLILILIASSASGASKIIPGPDEYGDFLVGDWKPDRPTVVVFKDPFCPYCIKAIGKLDSLSDYNVFLFWSPILGKASERRVDEIFHCTRPVSRKVLTAVASRAPPDCHGDRRDELIRLNRQVVDSYHVYAVPAYFFQGRPVSVSMLAKAPPQHPVINGVVVDWDRFGIMRRNGQRQPKTLALIIRDTDEHRARQLIAANEPEYLFLGQGLAAGHPELLPCTSQGRSCDADYLHRYRSRYAEFSLLLGLPADSGGAMVLQKNGLLAQVTP